MLGGEVKHVFNGSYELRGNQLLDLLGAEAFDVERASAGEVYDSANQLRRAIEVAAVEELAF